MLNMNGAEFQREINKDLESSKDDGSLFNTSNDKNCEKQNDAQSNESANSVGNAPNVVAPMQRRKKQKLKWDDALHKRFIKAITNIGFEKAVPKNVLEYMNVHGLTRTHIASHLQKYRQYLKRTGELPDRRNTTNKVQNYSFAPLLPRVMLHNLQSRTSFNTPGASSSNSVPPGGHNGPYLLGNASLYPQPLTDSSSSSSSSRRSSAFGMNNIASGNFMPHYPRNAPNGLNTDGMPSMLINLRNQVTNSNLNYAPQYGNMVSSSNNGFASNSNYAGNQFPGSSMQLGGMSDQLQVNGDSFQGNFWSTFCSNNVSPGITNDGTPHFTAQRNANANASAAMHNVQEDAASIMRSLQSTQFGNTGTVDAGNTLTSDQINIDYLLDISEPGQFDEFDPSIFSEQSSLVQCHQDAALNEFLNAHSTQNVNPVEGNIPNQQENPSDDPFFEALFDQEIGNVSFPPISSPGELHPPMNQTEFLEQNQSAAETIPMTGHSLAQNNVIDVEQQQILNATSLQSSAPSAAYVPRSVGEQIPIPEHSLNQFPGTLNPISNNADTSQNQGTNNIAGISYENPGYEDFMAIEELLKYDDDSDAYFLGLDIIPDY